MSNFQLFKATDRDRDNLDRSLINIISKLKVYKLQYPDLSNAELFEQYKKDNIELLNLLLSQRSVRADTFRLNAINTLISNPYSFMKMYNDVLHDARDGKVNLDNIDDLNITLNAEECQRTHTIDSIYSARKELEANLTAMKLTPYQLSKIDLKALRRSGFTKEAIEELAYLKKPEFERITIMTKQYKTKFEATLKQTYVDTIMCYYEQFKKLGFINNYTLNQTKKFPQDLAVTVEELDEFFTPDNLTKLGITELSALYAFYSNRYTKELQELETLNFCLAYGYSLDDFMNAEDPSQVIPEYMKAPLINEQKCITEISDELLLTGRIEAHKKQSFLAPENTYSATFDLTTAVSKEVKQEYMAQFHKKEKDFYRIMSQTFTLRNHTSNQYFSKDSSMISLLSTIASNKDKVENWGIILEKDEYDDEPKSLNLKRKYLLLGFDIKGLNMPLRLHIPTDSIKDFAREYLDSEYFPIYDGDQDFRYNARPLSTPLLYGQPKRVVENLKAKLASKKQGEPVYQSDRLYSHLLYIADSSTQLPDHLKSEVTEGKKGHKKKKLKHIKRYASVKTGDIYTTKQLSALNQKY